eukprot:COSAG02_NODE_1938_length_10312_cov_16.495741_9_plen_355_part_00
MLTFCGHRWFGTACRSASSVGQCVSPPHWGQLCSGCDGARTVYCVYVLSRAKTVPGTRVRRCACMCRRRAHGRPRARGTPDRTAILANMIWRSLQHVPANSQKSRRAPQGRRCRNGCTSGSTTATSASESMRHKLVAVHFAAACCNVPCAGSRSNARADADVDVHVAARQRPHIVLGPDGTTSVALTNGAQLVSEGGRAGDATIAFLQTIRTHDGQASAGRFKTDDDGRESVRLVATVSCDGTLVEHPPNALPAVAPGNATREPGQHIGSSLGGSLSWCGRLRPSASYVAESIAGRATNHATAGAVVTRCSQLVTMEDPHTHQHTKPLAQPAALLPGGTPETSCCALRATSSPR